MGHGVNNDNTACKRWGTEEGDSTGFLQDFPKSKGLARQRAEPGWRGWGHGHMQTGRFSDCSQMGTGWS